MAAFIIGDTVQLKSGGPLMRVVALHGDSADCIYFNSVDPQGESEPLPFALDTLRPADASVADKPVDEARENSKFGDA